jgi:hypothetical protein
MIALLTTEPNRGTKPNRPGQGIITLLEGQVRLQSGADLAKLDKDYCAHYGRYEDHSAWNIGDKPAKILCIKIVC